MFTKTRVAAERVARSIEQYLTRKLKLVVNHQKSRICKTSEVDFLGFSFTGYSGQLRVSPKNLKKFKDRTREITRRNRGVSIKHRLLELRRYFQGWVGYFKIIPIKSFFRELDKWARRRLRSCYWKQWRGLRTRIANLKKLGVRNREAITHGVSSKGPCCTLRKSGHVLELRSSRCTLNGLPHRTRTGQSRGDLAEAYCEEAKRLSSGPAC